MESNPCRLIGDERYIRILYRTYLKR
ncbi:hypothetical protein [Aerococcus viridans]